MHYALEYLSPIVESLNRIKLQIFMIKNINIGLYMNVLQDSNIVKLDHGLDLQSNNDETSDTQLETNI